jgi:hypothetical protein
MTTVGLLFLVAAFFFTPAISVLTGGTSLLTVPVMLSFGVEPHVAVALFASHVDPRHGSARRGSNEAPKESNHVHGRENRQRRTGAYRH